MADEMVAEEVAAAQPAEDPPSPSPLEALSPSPPASADAPSPAPDGPSPEKADAPSPSPEPSAFSRAAAAPPPPAPIFAGEGQEAAAFLSDSALVALYLRRLGFDEDEVANHARGKPLKQPSGAKALLTDLVQRHVLRVPFENIGRQRSPVGLRGCAERIACGIQGGTSIVINMAFAWLLQELGADARLALAAAPAPGCAASHVTVMVDISDGLHIADPGFCDPPRTAVRLDGEAADDLATYKVASSEGSGAPADFDTVLTRTRGTSSFSRHAWSPDDASLDSQEAQATAVFAFRREDRLGDQELQAALEASRTESGRLYTEQRLVLLALPNGHISLSERCCRKVEGANVVSEEAIADEAAWRARASEVLAMPLTSKPGQIGRALNPKPTNGTSFADRRSVFNAPGRTPTNGPLRGVQASRGAAESASKRLGLVDASSIAVGGAGAGGGLGLNAPGYGTKVQHFSGGCGNGGSRSISVSEEIREAWQHVMDDNSPIGWVYCEYGTDGKTLDLKGSGPGGLQDFRENLGTSLAWGGFRCAGVDRRGGLECKRPKFIFVQYKPEAASAMKKAKAASHKGDVKEAICGAHIDVAVETLRDLDEQALITKLQAATGAHKPNGYEFQEGVFLEADFYGLGIGKDCRGETSKN